MIALLALSTSHVTTLTHGQLSVHLVATVALATAQVNTTASDATTTVRTIVTCPTEELAKLAAANQKCLDLFLPCVGDADNAKRCTCSLSLSACSRAVVLPACVVPLPTPATPLTNA